jgi:hypothetical protein
MADIDLGTDFMGLRDIDPNFTLVGGKLVYAFAIARRLTTPRGSLFYDDDYGMDLRQFLSGSVQRPDVIQAQVETEALKDERTQDAKCTVAFENETLSVELLLTTSEGPFNLTVAVSSLTTQLLLENR